jgi:hypothetical protein
MNSRPVLFLISILILWTSQVMAQERYICSCDTGADADCEAGSDSASGSIAAPWLSYEKARTEFSSLSPGGAIRFCRGGAWDVIAGTRWVNQGCEAGNPCVVGDYAAPWGSGDEERPIIQRLDSAHGFALEDGGNAEHEEGYVFENLDLRGTGTESGWGFFLYNDIDDVVIRDLSITEFAIGVHLAGSNACNAADPDCDGRNERITLLHSSIRDNSAQGWLGASSGTQILLNDF